MNFEFLDLRQADRQVPLAKPLGMFKSERKSESLFLTYIQEKFRRNKNSNFRLFVSLLNPPVVFSDFGLALTICLCCFFSSLLSGGSTVSLASTSEFINKQNSTEKVLDFTDVFDFIRGPVCKVIVGVM